MFLSTSQNLEDLQPLIGKIIKRDGGWRGRLPSFAARVELIKSCLACIPIYLQSVIMFLASAIKIINSRMAHCLWDNYDRHHKYHLANWDLVTLKNSMGVWDTERPDVFSCREADTSPFWKGLMWAAQAAQMGYQWLAGRDKIRFWEDQQFGQTIFLGALEVP